ncbi:MAG: nucleotidyltransferase domain-containing protein [Deltaproteobacteria bacterium]|nr:nucleotidyltransferase domain-containing protein [Deltaproteobacteria bacterium]
MKFGLTEKEELSIKRVFDEFPEIQEVIIFGSRAIGNFKPASDIDLAIKGISIDLGLLGKIKAQLEENTPVPYFFDLVNLETISHKELKEHIREHGRTFYTTRSTVLNSP